MSGGSDSSITLPQALSDSNSASHPLKMTKDNSRRSSAGGSVHTPTAQENGEDHHAPESQLPSGPSLSVASSDPMDVDTNKPGATGSNISMRQPESQPMTASNSTSSNPSTNEVASGTAATYGTRSRRTTTITRPNYAEDKELDAEFELSPVKEPKRKYTKGGADTTPTTTNADFGRNVKPPPMEAPEEDLIVSMPSHYKDPIPGTSTFSAKPTTKKRKATTQPPPPETFRPYQVPQPNYFVPQPTNRKSGHAAELVPGIRESNMLSFDNCQGRLKGKKLVADDGTVLDINDHVYMICEPPGEPYYMGRIMEFVHANGDPSKAVEALRLNWYYRPKDIGRNVNDTRQVFASMHSDISPLTALRGKCQIKHRSEFEKLDDIRRKNDCFWYEKLYDRYIHRYYDVIPSKTVINVPANVKKVLDERWKFIVVEPTRGKELTSAKKSCKKCNKYCANNDSVDCAVCKNTYHMSCVSPPLQKKPSRGFAWACGPCSKAQERKLEARLTPNVNDILDNEEDELNDEEDSPMSHEDVPEPDSNEVQTPAVVTAPNDIHQPSSWLFRYLGVHCKVEDVLDSDDRIYPRASSRLGPKHQAVVTPWHGKPVEYVEPVEIKKKMQKGTTGKKVMSFTKETVQALEWDRLDKESRPKWVMDKPTGYVHRGEDLDGNDPNNTAKLIFKLPESSEVSAHSERGADDTELSDQASISDRERLVNDYMSRAKQLAGPLGLPERSTNLLDMALDMLRAHSYDTEKALQALTLVDKEAFKEPELSATELKKFEDGVAKFGSEWHSIKKHVKTVSAANIVRFYYTWKKTERGKQVWGKYSGRKGKKEAKRNDTSTGKLQDDVADEYDDSAFDNNKAFQKKRRFQCKFCSTQYSRQWRRAPNTPAGSMIAENPLGKTGKEKGEKFMVALCRRCAELWRRYGIQWEDVDEAAKKLIPGYGRAWKRKIDEEILKELIAANETLYALNGPPMHPISGNGTPVPMPPGLQPGVEPPKKKVKGASGAQPELGEQPMDFGNITNPPPQKKKAEKPPPPPPPPPEPPKARILPCAVCNELEPMGDQLLACNWCRMSVHRSCYGVIGENRSVNKWVCDTCSNDKNPQVSHKYECVLCPVKFTEHDFVEPPKTTYKKKSEKDRERERLEREKAQKDADFFRQRQIDLNRPLNPREPLKRTANNNWVHVTCAVFTPEVKFSNARALEHSEGIPSIQPSKYDETCKACKQKGGACVPCRSCHASVHVECAHHAGYIIGFDVTPVKGSRRDHANIVTINGDTGTMAAAIWCKEHGPTKSTAHQLQTPVEGTDLTALQLFVQNYKQADLTLTGTVRKAMLINQSSKVLNPTPVAAVPNRKASTANAAASRGSVSHIKVEETPREVNAARRAGPDPICITCGADVSPKWYPYIPAAVESIPSGESLPQTNGEVHSGDSTMANGCTTEDPAEVTASQVAIATAALHENTRPSIPAPPVTTERQCHKCHVRNIKIKEPSPPPKSPSREPTPPPVETSTDVPMPDANMIPPVPQYAWAQPPYAPGGPYNNVQVPTPSPTIHGPPMNHVNGMPSPRINSGPQHFSSQVQMRPQGPSQSPHQNGHGIHGSNGYSAPTPHQDSSSAGGHIQNGSSYGSYVSTRPQPYHLTNGGPPPHAPERPFHRPVPADFRYVPPSSHMNGNGNLTRNTHGEPADGRREGSQRGVNGSPRQPDHPLRHHAPSESSRYSPPIPVDPALLAAGSAPQPEPYRHMNNGQNNGNGNGNQTQDRRIDGGASASPSLRNLLS